VYKSSINILYKSIEENFTKVSEEKQIDSKYKNLFIMKDNIINELHDYKRELYKDISVYNEVQFDLKRKTKELYSHTFNHIEYLNDIENILNNLR